VQIDVAASLPRKSATPNLVDELPLRGQQVAVAGMFRTRCGLQRGAKLMLADLHRRGYSAWAVDLSAPLLHPLDEHSAGLLIPADLDQLPISDLLIHLNPPLFANAVGCFSQSLRDRARITGYWAWELPVVSDAWRKCAHLCSAIWVPSPFVASTMFAGLSDFTGEIRVIPHQVDLDPMPRLTRDQRRILRESNEIAPSEFVCGVSFSFTSNYARKNPTAAVDAFMRAFSLLDPKPKLLIRAHDSQHHRKLFEHLVSYAEVDPRITVFDPLNRRWPINEFLPCLDVFLSLHRSEGYGLQIAEAAQAGVATLATGWGLAPDICARPEVITIGYRLVTALDPQGFYMQFDGAKWAEPDIDDAARWLRVLRARHTS
jgi:glycosyltransferase involved in cell wall biosynthesis